MNLEINSTQAQLETGALDLASHKLEPLGGDGELALYRAHPAESSKSSPSMLVVVPLTQPSPAVLVPARGLFASAKFDQDHPDIPYAALVQAFQGLVRPLLAKSEAELAGWREALQQALGSNARLVVDLVPEVKLIIGEPAPLTDLPPQDAQRRFQLVLRRFIGVFARAEHPLALFLDDLQWLDAATLEANPTMYFTVVTE